MEHKHIRTDWLLAFLRGAALLLIMVCLPAQAQAESKPSEQLVAAAKDGNLAEVQELIDAGAHVPGTPNSFRAIKFAKDRGHDEVLELLETGLNEYVSAGTPYDNIVGGYLEDLRTRAEENPGSIRWNIEKRLIAGVAIGFFNGLKKDPDGLMYPLGMAFDEEEFRRQFEPAFEALQAEYQVESDFERRMRETEETREAQMKENRAKIDEEEGENRSEPLFAPLSPIDDERDERQKKGER